MNHSNQSNGVADLIESVILQNISGQRGETQVARSRFGFVEERQGKQFRSSFQVEAWGMVAAKLAVIPQGHTVMWQGKFQNYSYKDQSGVEKWAVKITLFAVADCGPSQYSSAQQGQQSQQPSNYGRAPQQNQQAPAQTGFNGFGGGQQQARAPQAPQQNSGWGGQMPSGVSQDDVPF